jgi:hypothetical protein
MSDFDDMAELLLKQQDEVNKSRKELKGAKLRGTDIVKKNEEYIAKHREEEYQRQKADAERRLQDALAMHARPQHDLDETSRFDRHPNIIDPTTKEPGPQLNAPLFREGTGIDPKAQSWERRARLHRTRSHGIHIINRCIVT